MPTNDKPSSNIAEAVAVLDNSYDARNAKFNVGGDTLYWKDLNPLIKTEILLKGDPEDLYGKGIVTALSEHFKIADYNDNPAMAMADLRKQFNAPSKVESEKDFKSTFVDEDALRGIIPSTKEYQSMAYAPGEASDYDKANIGKKRNLIFDDRDERAKYLSKLGIAPPKDSTDTVAVQKYENDKKKAMLAFNETSERAKYLSSLGINPPEDSSDKVAAQQYEEDKKKAMRDLASSLAKIEYDEAESKYDDENTDWGKIYASLVWPRTVESIERGEYDNEPMGNYGIGDLGKLFGNRSSVADIGELAASAVPGKAIGNLVERIPGKIAAAAAPVVGKAVSFLVNNAAGPLVGNFVDPNITAGEAAGKTAGEVLTNATVPLAAKNIAKGAISKVFGDAPPAVVRSILRESPKKNLDYIEKSVRIMEQNFGEFADNYAKSLTNNVDEQKYVSLYLKNYFNDADAIEKADMLSRIKSGTLKDPIDYARQKAGSTLEESTSRTFMEPPKIADDADITYKIGRETYPKTREEAKRFLRDSKILDFPSTSLSKQARTAEIIDAASDPRKLQKALQDFKIENYMLSPAERKNRFGYLDVTEPEYFYGSDKHKKATKLLRNIPPDNVSNMPTDWANRTAYDPLNPAPPFDFSKPNELDSRLSKSWPAKVSAGIGDFNKSAGQRGLSLLSPLKAVVDIVGGPIDTFRPGTKAEVQDFISGGGNKDLEETYDRAKDLYNYRYPSYAGENNKKSLEDLWKEYDNLQNSSK